MKLGAHESIGGGLHRAVERAAADGCASFQLFTKAPQVWKEPRLDAAAIERFKAARRSTDAGPAIVHSSYLVNPCSSKPETRARGWEALAREAARCDELGIEQLTFHPGSPGALGEEEGAALVAAGIRHALAASSRVELLLENTAGQGASLGHRFEQLARIVELAGGEPRLGVCFDTCHAFAAGYDLRSGPRARRVLDELDAVVGAGRLRALHLNDSKTELGSRVDRHERIGRGAIGIEAFRWLVNEPRLAELPAVLETPIEKGETYAGELARLRALIE